MIVREAEIKEKCFMERDWKQREFPKKRLGGPKQNLDDLGEQKDLPRGIPKRGEGKDSARP